MNFGLCLWGLQAMRMRPRHHHLLYQELIDDVQYAEALGFDSLWVTEHHFWYDGYCPQPLVAVAAMAPVTRRIRLATGVILLPQHDPIKVAEDAAVADILSNGRLMLGVAVGYRDVEFDGFDVRRRDRGARMDEQLAVMRQAWTGQPFSFEGRHFRYHDIAVTPRPLQDPLPLWMGATSPGPVVRAAKLGLPVIFGGTLSPQRINQLVEVYYRTADEHGGDATGTLFSQTTNVWVCDTNEEAEREMIPRLRYLYREQLGGWRYLTDEQGNLIGFDRPAELDRAVEVAIANSLIGNPRRVIKGIERLQAAGLTYFNARVRFDSVPQEKLHRCMELLATEVMPHFQDA